MANVVEQPPPHPVREKYPVLISYLGSRPNGKMAPGLSLLPASDKVQYFLSACFFVDPNKDGRFVASDSLNNNPSPEALRQELDRHPNHRSRFVLICIGGDTDHWKNPTDGVDAWVNNACNSLSQLMQYYSAVGIDINYENMGEGVAITQSNGQQFIQCMTGLIKKLRPHGKNNIVNGYLQPIICLTPFLSTLETYIQIHKEAEDYVDLIHFQTYASGTINADASWEDLYAFYVNKIRNNSIQQLTWLKIIFGVSSESSADGTTHTVPQNWYNAVHMLNKDYGLRGVAIWCLDNSVEPDFTVERQAFALLESLAL